MSYLLRKLGMMFRVELKNAKQRVSVVFYFLFAVILHRIFRLITTKIAVQHVS